VPTATNPGAAALPRASLSIEQQVLDPHMIVEIFNVSE
jgi:hypothetical protein